jgi:hypothetical protein
MEHAFHDRLAGERLTTLVANLKALKTSDKVYAPLVDAALK